MTVRPDPSFHASPKLAMEAPPENFAYTLLLSASTKRAAPDSSFVRATRQGVAASNFVQQHLVFRYLPKARSPRRRGRAASVEKVSKTTPW